MKKIYLISALLGMLSMAFITSCSDKEGSVDLTGIDQASITYQAKPGAVKLKWEIPGNANYDYLKVTYNIPGEDKQRMRLASVYSDTMLVDNLLKRYGDILFTICPCDKAGNEGTPVTITAQAEAAQIVTKTERTKVTIASNRVWGDNPESSEGSLANLVDGNTTTYYHMSWSASTAFPHYIVLDMGTSPVTNFQIEYTCRDHANKDNPGEMDILVSDDFQDSAEYYKNETGTRLVHSFPSGELPSGKGAVFTSNSLKADAPFRYLWMKVKSSTSGQDWVALAEITVYKIKGSIYDPETGETTTIK